MRDNVRMTIATRCHQHPMRDLPAVIEDGISGEIAHPTIGFLHDQIRRRKVPIMTVAARKSRIQRAMGDPAQPQRERTDLRMQLDLAH